MKTTRFLSFALLAAMCLRPSAFAQSMFQATPRDLGKEMAKILGRNTAFSATSQTTIADARGKSMKIESAYAMLDGKVRTETDITKMQSGMPAQAMEHMKMMGMDRTVSLFLPETKASYLIYPGMKAYCQIAMPEPPQNQTQRPEPKVEKTELGKETIDSHPCVKWKITTTDENGKTSEWLVWQATDLKDFPIQTQVKTDDGSTVTTTFHNVNQSKPAASLFELPSDFQRYASVQELMMSNMQKMMPPGGGVPLGDRTPRNRQYDE